MNARADLDRLRALIDAPDDTPQPLPDKLPPVDPLPLVALPEAFRDWVEDAADRMQAPPDYIGLAMLVGAASLVARVVSFRPQLQGDWAVSPNLWGAPVGTPGMKKSPSMSEALLALSRLEAAAAEQHNEALAEFNATAEVRKLGATVKRGEAKKLLQNGGAEFDAAKLLKDGGAEAEPVRRRYIVNDTSYERLGEILADNPGGVLTVRDELRGLLLMLSEESNASARGFFLQGWSGGPYTFDRITRGCVSIPNLRLSLLGAIQPGPLSSLIREAKRGGRDDGLIERFLFVWPDPLKGWRDTDRKPNQPAKDAAAGAFARLDRLTAADLGASVDTDSDGTPMGEPYLRPTPEARSAFVEWRSGLANRMAGEGQPSLESALAKFDHHVPSLALVLHVVDGGTGPVSERAMVQALALAEYFETHTRRVHGSGNQPVVAAASAILARARSKSRDGGLPDPFSARDVYRRGWSGLTDQQLVSEALDTLVVHGWLTDAAIRPAAIGGRPTTVYSLTAGARHG